MKKSSVLNVEISGSEEQAKFGFPVAIVTAYRVNFKKSYLTQFLSELSHYYTQIEAQMSSFWENYPHLHIQNSLRAINKMVSRGHLMENNFSTININGSQISFQLTLIGSNYSHFRRN